MNTTILLPYCSTCTFRWLFCTREINTKRAFFLLKYMSAKPSSSMRQMNEPAWVHSLLLLIIMLSNVLVAC